MTNLAELATRHFMPLSGPETSWWTAADTWTLGPSAAIAPAAGAIAPIRATSAVTRSNFRIRETSCMRPTVGGPGTGPELGVIVRLIA